MPPKKSVNKHPAKKAIQRTDLGYTAAAVTVWIPISMHRPTTTPTVLPRRGQQTTGWSRAGSARSPAPLPTHRGWDRSWAPLSKHRGWDRSWEGRGARRHPVYSRRATKFRPAGVRQSSNSAPAPSQSWCSSPLKYPSMSSSPLPRSPRGMGLFVEA